MRHAVLLTVLILLLAAGCTAMGDPVDGGVKNLSDSRGLGIGMQVGLPFGGLLSARYWFTPTFGAEGILFVAGDEWFFEGQGTGRVLYRALDAETVDLYLAGGLTVPFEERDAVVSALAGIEFGFRAAPHVAWNIEFGMTYALSGEFNMGIGTGIHVYFTRPVPRDPSD